MSTESQRIIKRAVLVSTLCHAFSFQQGETSWQAASFVEYF